VNPGRPRARVAQRNEPPDRSGLRSARSAQQACDCPACSGQEFDPEELLAGLLDDVAPLAEIEDALDAELTGAAFLAMVAALDDDALPMLTEAFIPAVESRPGPGALAMLRALARVASGVEPRLAAAASAAADRVVAAGVPEPGWAAALAEPIDVSECARLHDDGGAFSVLSASFRRSGRGQALVIVVDELNCGAAADIFLVEADELPTALEDICARGRAEGYVLRMQTLDPAEFRWYAEEALASRAVHEEDDPADEEWAAPDEAGDGEDEEDPPYAVMAQLTRSRLAALPKARRPAGAHCHEESHTHALSALDLLVGGASGRSGARFGLRGSGRAAPATLPAKRKKKDGPAPIYQVKVTLRGAKPPIWRRLEVLADLSLADLHDVIQAAFGWDDGHMHVFETPYGDFGRADPELGHRSEASVTLEQVAPRATDKIRYTYDFGDDWEHEILVEKVLDRDQVAVAQPRCTGGRRAGPPEDCGGIWGYAQLLEILADPRHPDHEERLEWLGLDDPNQFDPAAFDLKEVNRALAELR
jgi:Plasmid pRiA4b ORF-3-like protein